MKIIDRYAEAVRTSDLGSKPSTTYSASDVLGAAGLASREVLSDGRPGSPLAIALLRLFVGDNGASGRLVAILSNMLVGKAYRMGAEIGRLEAQDTAKAVLAWHRDAVCKPCGGHGRMLITGTTTIGDEECRKCRGEGKLPFDRQFKTGRVELARWLISEVEREQAIAGPEAMKMLAPRLF